MTVAMYMCVWFKTAVDRLCAVTRNIFQTVFTTKLKYNLDFVLQSLNASKYIFSCSQNCFIKHRGKNHMLPVDQNATKTFSY